MKNAHAAFPKTANWQQRRGAKPFGPRKICVPELTRAEPVMFATFSNHLKTAYEISLGLVGLGDVYKRQQSNYRKYAQ